MMPAHYAMSDAAILLVAIWAGVALWRQGQRIAAFAMACFGIPAAIGVIRLGGSLQTELAALHAGASQLLGLAGAITLAAACFPRTVNGDHRWVVGLTLMTASAAFFFTKGLLPPFFITALLLAFGAALGNALKIGSSWLVPSGLMILMIDVLFVRGASWLTDAVRWHAYHVLIALALGIVAKGLLDDRNKAIDLAVDRKSS